jgi:hypothetical protein
MTPDEQAAAEATIRSWWESDPEFAEWLIEMERQDNDRE